MAENMNAPKRKVNSIIFIILMVLSLIVVGGYSCRIHKEIRNETAAIMAAHDSTRQALRYTIETCKVDTTKVSFQIDEATLRQLEYDQQMIKDLLDNQFDKLQTERNVLEIWAAAITIVFLVFSLYSIFHTDEILNDARRNAGKINELYSMAEATGNKIKSEMETKLAPIASKVETLEQKAQTISNTLQEAGALQAKLDEVTALKDNISLRSERWQELEQQVASLQQTLEKIQETVSVRKTSNVTPEEETQTTAEEGEE